MKRSEPLLLDASVLVALFTPDLHSTSAVDLVSGFAHRPVVTDFAVGEFASAIAIKVRQGQLSRDEARTVFGAFDVWTERMAGPVALMRSDLITAAELVRRFDLALRLPDAIHIAVTRRLGAVLATFDRQQARACVAVGLPVASEQG